MFIEASSISVCYTHADLAPLQRGKPVQKPRICSTTRQKLRHEFMLHLRSFCCHGHATKICCSIHTCRRCQRLQRHLLLSVHHQLLPPVLESLRISAVSGFVAPDPDRQRPLVVCISSHNGLEQHPDCADDLIPCPVLSPPFVPKEPEHQSFAGSIPGGNCWSLEALPCSILAPETAIPLPDAMSEDMSCVSSMMQTGVLCSRKPRS